MKRLVTIALASACCLGLACGGQSPQGPNPQSHLQVYVYWNNAGVADRRVEVVGTGLQARTNTDGIAEFFVAPGAYTLRVYGINRPGPSADLEFSVKATPGETTRVDVVDCLPCVGASRAP